VLWFQLTPESNNTQRRASTHTPIRESILDKSELIYRDRSAYTIDTDLKSLGIESNRKPETLEKLIALLREKQKAALARKLLGRYTVEAFETPRQWQVWLTNNRERIYFSDVGGYKFRVAP